MASLKDIKNQIKSVSNTRKITRTMEMVSAAKSKQTINRVESSTPYSEKLRELMDGLSGGGSVDSYLVQERETIERSALLVVTANRGLCGGYNTNVSNLAEQWIRSELAADRKVHVSMVGKKGEARFRFRKVQVDEKFAHIEDKPSFKDAEEFAVRYMEMFKKGEVDRVLVAVTRYISQGRQVPELVQLLPMAPPEDDVAAGESAAQKTETDYIFVPNAEAILADLLPFSVKHTLYRLFLEAAASEQIARRVAMKNATDNAGELLKGYTGQYNRQRQASITQQIMEIVGGAEALE